MEQQSQREYWNSRAASWGSYGEPLIPNSIELEFQQRHLIEGGDTLILGATPQLCALALETSSTVTAVDFAEEVIEALRIDNVEYICKDWLTFLEENEVQYDNILTDGGLVCLQYPDTWQRISTLIYSRLRPGGVFSPRVYLSTENSPKEHYDNPNLARFIPSIADVDEHWMTQVKTNQSYQNYDVAYAFPPREAVLRTFGQFALKGEFIPTFEEGDRFVSFAFQRKAVEG